MGRIGCTLCLLGSLIIVLHAPPDKDIQTVDEILQFAVQPGPFPLFDAILEILSLSSGFMLYCFTVLVFSLFMIYRVSPRYGKKNPVVYISICSLVGSVSVMAIKGFGIAVKLTFAGNNQFTHPSTYVFAIVVTVCIMVQMNYFNKALDTFSTNVYVSSSRFLHFCHPYFSTVSIQCTMSGFRLVPLPHPSFFSKGSTQQMLPIQYPLLRVLLSLLWVFTFSTYHESRRLLQQRMVTQMGMFGEALHWTRVL